MTVDYHLGEPLPIQVNQDTIHLSLGQFSTCSIALKGATVYSYTQNTIERLFTSSLSSLSTSDPTPIRGGVPLCWPIFGPPNKDNELYNKLKQHGFARSSTWQFVKEESECQGENGCHAVFKLEPTPSITSLFPLPFSLKYLVSLSPSGLSLSLTVSSPSSAIAPLPFQALLHSYFRLPDSINPTLVKVTPLENLRYTDKILGGAEETERRKEVMVDGPGGEVDRVYLRASDRLKLSWGEEGAGGGGVEMKKKNLCDVVLWNPGPEKGKGMKDLEEGGAARFVCLEPGQTSQWVSLEPGEEWTGSIDLSFT
ncbi:hypothetical protein JCM5353_003232 [Sporobolomyces roseus]